VRRFTNKIVVITGGTSGIGLAAAKQFIKEGAKVIVTGRSPQSVGDAQNEIGADGVAIAADVTKSAELDSLFQQVRQKYGRIDVLYVNAGIAKLGSVAETTEDVFDDIITPLSQPLEALERLVEGTSSNGARTDLVGVRRPPRDSMSALVPKPDIGSPRFTGILVLS
jgi:short-subunit dehydrogenase involved in D-alanine esterification of teichoic acids